MPQHRHKAIAAGLALTLTFGALAVPALATTSDAHAADGASSDGALPAPSDFDRMDEFDSESVLAEESVPAAASVSRAVAGLSDEMKYFSKFESSCNYDQGFSYGDGYNAMGYYQFDRRHALVPFIESTYRYNPTKYSMFAEVVKRGSEVKTGVIYDSSTKKLTELGQLVENAWHAAYATDPVEFAALQDNYSYANYYLPIENTLKEDYKVDISDRADCVKGLAWGMCNLYGSGGVHKFFRAAGLSDGMTDREMVNALCDAVINYYTTGDGKGHTYAKSYANRYRNEKSVCLSYISQHEAEQEQEQSKPETKPEAQPEVQPETKPEVQPESKPEVDAEPEAEQDGAGSEGAPGAGDAGSSEEPGVDGEGSTVPPASDDGGDAPSAGQGDSADDGQGQSGGQASDPGMGGDVQGQTGAEASKTHSVIFDDCDPTTENPMFTVLEGSSFSAQNKLPADPENADHVFDGWYEYDPDTKLYGGKFDPSAPVTRDMYVAAKWMPKTFGGIADPKVDLELTEDEKKAAEEEVKQKRLAQTSDAAGIAMVAAAALSATGTAAIALGGKAHLRRSSGSEKRDE